MATVNDLNKIYCDSPITIKKINMTSLLFADSLVVSKSMYSVVDNYINILEQASDFICLYQHRDSSYYYEFEVSLKQAGVVLTGPDKFYNELDHLRQGGVLVFVDGYKLLPSQFEILSNNSIKILNAFIVNERSTVIIYTSSSLYYVGTVDTQEDWNPDKHSFILDDYTYLRYLFFKNGEIITRDKITKVRDTVTINIDIRSSDIISFYRLPIDTENVLFKADPGYFSYGPEDISGLKVPEIYDAEVTFDVKVKYAIDDVRQGFFIRENDSVGCLMIIGNEFETRTAKAITIAEFSSLSLKADEYYLQVPEARSILHYISEYDLNRMLMPELLGSFQKLLLNEVYDCVQRLKNSRSIENVDSQHIGKLLNFLGLSLDITDLSLENKHALLEELNNFYRIVGTRESYNFYNTMAVNSRIIKIDQLFTPIKDIATVSDYAERYVDFRTAEELGAVTHREYVFDKYDFGSVDQLASPVDSFTNQPRSSGVLENTQIPAVLKNTRTLIYIYGKMEENTNNILDDWNNVIGTIDPNKNILDLNGHVVGKLNRIVTRTVKSNGVTINHHLAEIVEEKETPTNNYLVAPKAGPNQPHKDWDFGSVADNAVNFYDLGYVWEIIKGKWIEWTTWDRPKEWYPTNHVDVSVQVPADIDYQTFMTEFKNTFYNIASAVLYIHSIIEVYMFGKENPWMTSDADEALGGAANFDMLTAPIYYETEYAFTNDPARQDYRAN